MGISKSFFVASLSLLLAVLASTGEGSHQPVVMPVAMELSAKYYRKTCPNVQNAVRTVMEHRLDMAPAVLRLFFHDCFVNVSICTSLVLHDTPYERRMHKCFCVSQSSMTHLGL
jgi:peroxidase